MLEINFNPNASLRLEIIDDHPPASNMQQLHLPPLKERWKIDFELLTQALTSREQEASRRCFEWMLEDLSNSYQQHIWLRAAAQVSHYIHQHTVLKMLVKGIENCRKNNKLFEAAIRLTERMSPADFLAIAYGLRKEWDELRRHCKWQVLYDKARQWLQTLKGVNFLWCYFFESCQKLQMSFPDAVQSFPAHERARIYLLKARYEKSKADHNYSHSFLQATQYAEGSRELPFILLESAKSLFDRTKPVSLGEVKQLCDKAIEVVKKDPYTFFEYCQAIIEKAHVLEIFGAAIEARNLLTDTSMAELSFKNVGEIQKAEAKELIWKARIYLEIRQGNPGPARTLVVDACRMFPKSCSLMHLDKHLYFNIIGVRKLGLQTLTKAIETRSAELYCLLAQHYMTFKDPDFNKVRLYLEKAMEYNPHYGDTYIEYARCLLWEMEDESVDFSWLKKEANKYPQKQGVQWNILKENCFSTPSDILDRAITIIKKESSKTGLLALLLDPGPIFPTYTELPGAVKSGKLREIAQVNRHLLFSDIPD